MLLVAVLTLNSFNKEHYFQVLLNAHYNPKKTWPHTHYWIVQIFFFIGSNS